MSNRYPIKRSDGRLDKRYTIDLEHTGAITKKYVLRFCWNWISCTMQYKHAVEVARDHNDKRLL